MKPYYQHAGIAIYHGDCRDHLPAMDIDSVDLLLTDPPYGIAIGRVTGGDRGKSCPESGPEELAGIRGRARVHIRNVAGDGAPFDPAHLLKFRRVVLFGANHYSDKLPASPSWIIWDKRAGGKSDDSADCELAWTNLGGPARLFTHLWRGMIKGSERKEKRVHPTQKPVALMTWCLMRSAVPHGGLVVDPYMGSGTTLLAAKALNIRAVGVELEERYCELAAQRLSQEALPLGAAK